MVTRAEVQAYVARVTFSGLLKALDMRLVLLPIEVAHDGYTADGFVSLQLATSKMPDRLTGEPSTLSFTTRTLLMALQDETALAVCIHRLIADLMRHEADEALLVDGVRIFDPHRNDDCDHPYWNHGIRMLPTRVVTFVNDAPTTPAAEMVKQCTVCGTAGVEDIAARTYDPHGLHGQAAKLQRPPPNTLRIGK